ncbi:MAG TPA: YraN family protein [Bauldia sp.]|nr:YraN family protein [Bauldia sp.]
MRRPSEREAQRRAAERAGRRAELIAAWFLRLKLYRVLARRYRTPVGEIDLIVRRGRTIAFVEVKQRPSEGEGFEAVRPAAARRIARAADFWLGAHPAAVGLDCRFDIVVAIPGRRPRHLVSAFDGEGRPW